MASRHYAKVSMLMLVAADSVYDALVDPRKICKFWLRRSSAPLRQGESVRWEFLVPGVTESTTVEKLRAPELVQFRWSDGVRVTIEIEKHTRRSAVVRVKAGPFATTSKTVNAAEGFSIVLSDMKVWLETGKSPNLVRAKARLIAS